MVLRAAQAALRCAEGYKSATKLDPEGQDADSSRSVSPAPSFT